MGKEAIASTPEPGRARGQAAPAGLAKGMSGGPAARARSRGLRWLLECGLEGFLEGICAWLCIPPLPGSADRPLDPDGGPAGSPRREPLPRR